MRFGTKVVHIGQKPDETTGAVIPPIYQTSTYAQAYPAQHKGYEYTRAGNPNYTNLEALIAALENGAHGIVYSSGLGATTALLMQLISGDHVVAVDDVYGGTYRLLTKLGERFGIEVSFVSGSSLDDWRTAFLSSTKYVWLESPTNPLLKVVDIEEISALAKKRGAVTVVDNTFSSPAFLQPLSLGADVVLHSTTKYIGGHSDVIGGAIVTNNGKFAEQLVAARMIYGLNPSPFDAWLTQRGVKTLNLRMQQHERGAKMVAEFLEKHPCVEKVYYPGLKQHEGHDIAKKQMSGFGGMVTVRFDTDVESVKKGISGFHFFRLAESLGGVESLVCHPATMTHASVPREIREKRGITETLVRFSVGIEDPADLLEDLESTLKRW